MKKFKLIIVAGLVSGVLTGLVVDGEPTSSLYPAEQSGNVIYGNRGGFTHSIVLIANATDKPISSCTLILTAPSSLPLLTNEKYFSNREERAVLRNGIRMSEYTLRLAKKRLPETGIALGKLLDHQGTLIMFQLPNDVKEGRYPLFYRVISSIGNEAEHKLAIEVLPPAIGKHLKRFQIIMDPWCFYGNDEQWKLIAQCYKKMGMTGLSHCDTSVKIVQSCGLTPSIMLSWPPPLEASTSHKKILKQHPEWAAVGSDGKKKSNVVCPSILASNSVAMRQLVNLKLGRIDESVRHIWVDQEGPSVKDVCFCKRCISKFRKAYKIPEDQKLNAETIKTHHFKQWTNFCCSQTTEAYKLMVPTIKERYPQIEFGAYAGQPSDYNRYSNRVNWCGLSSALDIAHPDFYTNKVWNIKYSFSYALPEFIASVKSRNPAIKVMPTLTMGDVRGRIVPPKLTKLQLVATAAAGADGVMYWPWLSGDGRHYASVAQAIDIIAQFEDLLRTGQLVGGVKTQKKDGRIFIRTKQNHTGSLILVFNLSTSSFDTTIDLRKLNLPPAWKGRDFAGREVETTKFHKLHFDGMDVQWIFFGPV